MGSLGRIRREIHRTLFYQIQKETWKVLWVFIMVMVTIKIFNNYLFVYILKLVRYGFSVKKGLQNHLNEEYH